MHDSVPQRFSYVIELDEDYYGVVSSTRANTTVVMEGFWMFKRNGTYYLAGSYLSGYGVNDNFYLTATHPLGPWIYRGLIAPKGTDTFHSQTFQVSVSLVLHRHSWASNLLGGCFCWCKSVFWPVELKFTCVRVTTHMQHRHTHTQHTHTHTAHTHKHTH